MDVSILCPNLSNNSLGRAYVLAQLIERNHNVEIIGPKINGTIWEPVRDDYEYEAIESGPETHRLVLDSSEILSRINGDVVYASKPRMASFGIGLLEKLWNEKPLILDIDDWETGLNYGRRGKWLSPLIGIPGLIHHNTFYYTRLCEKLASVADARTVSTSMLQNKFGGEIIEHARDTEHFNPGKYNQADARKRHDIPADDFVVMFSGTPRPHKGVEELAKAVADIDENNIQLIIVGAEDSDYVDTIRSIGGEKVTVRGTQPFSQIPSWIAAADMIAIPQRSTPETRGQLPAKVFDAMAMAKPVVATNISDLPEVLEGCGIIVPPNSPKHLSEAILNLYRNRTLRERLGRKARDKCVKNYSYDALAPKMDRIISEL